jgi:hypothetical protein
MSGDCFLVLRDDSSGTPRWVVRKGERAYGEYLSEEAALADALEAAQDAREGAPRCGFYSTPATARLRSNGAARRCGRRRLPCRSEPRRGSRPRGPALRSRSVCGMAAMPVTNGCHSFGDD